MLLTSEASCTLALKVVVKVCELEDVLITERIGLRVWKARFKVD